MAWHSHTLRDCGTALPARCTVASHFCDRKMCMVVSAADKPIFFLHYVLIPSCAPVP